MALLSEQQMHFVIGFNYNYDFVCFSGVFQVFLSILTNSLNVTLVWTIWYILSTSCARHYAPPSDIYNVDVASTAIAFGRVPRYFVVSIE